MMLSFTDTSITTIRPAVIRERGSDWLDWGNAPRSVIEGCQASFGPSKEDNDGQDASMVVATVVAPWGADIRPLDKVMVDYAPGIELSVKGHPRPVKSATGQLDHLYVELQQWTPDLGRESL